MPIDSTTLTGTTMSHFPSLLHRLPRFEEPFEAFRLAAKDCEVLFASYPTDTTIAAHSHETENVGVITKGELVLTIDGKETRFSPGMGYHVPAGTTHAARFETETSGIEFWFSVT